MPTIELDLILCAIISALLVGSGWEARGWKDNASIEAAKDKQEIAIVAKERNDQIITNGVENAYQQQINAVDLDYDAFIKRLYSIPSVTVPTAPPSAGRPDATACPGGSARSNQENVAHLADLAYKNKLVQQQRQQLLFLQEWACKQGLAQCSSK